MSSKTSKNDDVKCEELRRMLVESTKEESSSSSDESEEEDSFGNTSEDAPSSDSSNESSNEAESEHLGFPAILSATSLKVMAQSSKANISLETSAALGELAMKKLRQAVLLADEFRKHERSCGLTSDNLSSAERFLKMESYGHSSPYFLPPYNSVGKGISILSDPPLIHLFYSFSEGREKPKLLLPLQNQYFKYTYIYPKTTKIVHSSTRELGYYRDIDISAVGTRIEEKVVKVLLLNEEKVETVKNRKCVTVGIEWIDYMKIFVNLFFNNNPSRNYWTLNNRKSRLSERELDFRKVIDDIILNGASPVLGTIFSFFTDYIDSRFGPSHPNGFDQVLSVLRALLTSSVRLDPPHVRDAFLVLTSLTHRSPPIAIHENIAHVFMLILKKSKDKFLVESTTWICKFVSHALKLLDENYSKSSDFYKNILMINLAVRLAIALEENDINLFLALGWHELFHKFIQKQLALRELSSTDSELLQEYKSDIEKLIELYSETDESILNGCRILLKKYSRAATQNYLDKIHEDCTQLFGEKLVPYLETDSSLVSSSLVKDKFVTNNSSSSSRYNKNRDKKKLRYLFKPIKRQRVIIGPFPFTRLQNKIMK